MIHWAQFSIWDHHQSKQYCTLQGQLSESHKSLDHVLIQSTQRWFKDCPAYKWSQFSFWVHVIIPRILCKPWLLHHTIPYQMPLVLETRWHCEYFIMKKSMLLSTSRQKKPDKHCYTLQNEKWKLIFNSSEYLIKIYIGVTITINSSWQLNNK